MHRPHDLDTASSLAFLQEEALEDQVVKKTDSHQYSKKSSHESSKHNTSSHTSAHKSVEDKKTTVAASTKSGDDKVSALKNYRRAKGLCFKCGEKWGPQHKCPPTVSLNAME